MSEALVLEGLTGQVVVKQPGSIAGQAVALKDLDGCEVYLLDLSSVVEVSNCSQCKLFIGPVAGPAVLTGVSSSTVALAAQRLSVKASQDVDLGVFSATPPEVEQSSNIRISCWMGAYPGLTSQFQLANLDPLSNHWDKAVDHDESGFGAAFELVDAVEYWEPPLDGYGPPDNPVPAPDGTLYAAPADANGDFPAENGHLGMTGGSGSATLGTTGTFSAGSGAGFPTGAGAFGQTAPAPTAGDHPKVAAMKERMRQRTAQQEADEQAAKQQLAEKANQHLENFYQRRQAQVGQRAKDNRSSSSAGPGDGSHQLDGTSPWEKTLNLINFNFLRASAADKARFKAVLFSAKGNNTPINSRSV